MKAAFFTMLVLSIVLGGIAYHKSPQLPIQAIKSGGGLLLRLIPVLILAFFVAGLMEVLLPTELLVRWVGAESGFKGILIGTCLGAVAPGGPFIQFPIVAAMFKAGANIGPLIAYLSAWALIGLNRVIAFEIPLVRVSNYFYQTPLQFHFSNNYRLYGQVDVCEGPVLID